MKKILTVLLITLIMIGCASGKNQMNEVTSQVYIGMPIAEFNKIVPKKRLIEMRQDITVYKVTKRVWYDSDGSGEDYRFFYFVEGKLTAIDQGERAVDYRVKID